MKKMIAFMIVNLLMLNVAGAAGSQIQIDGNKAEELFKGFTSTFKSQCQGGNCTIVFEDLQCSFFPGMSYVCTTTTPESSKKLRGLGESANSLSAAISKIRKGICEIITDCRSAKLSGQCFRTGDFLPSTYECDLNIEE